MNISNQSADTAIWLKRQPNFTIPEHRKKDKAGPVDFTTFDDDQSKAMAELIEFIESVKKDPLFRTLKGYAGSGKTYVTSRLEEWLVHEKKMRVAVTAPTNKAVKVLKDMCNIEDKNLKFMTIHKLLGLKMKRDRGVLEFVADNNDFNHLSEYDVLIIDEVSMLEMPLFMHVYRSITEADTHIKVVLVGDPAQIPPVDSNDCVPFIPKYQKKYSIEESVLTNIRRQAQDNPLLKYATHIRMNRQKDEDTFDYKTTMHGSDGLIVLEKENKELIYQLCSEYFDNDIFSRYPDFMKVIAWRNVTVNAINDKIRQLIYKQDKLPRILVGEKLIADEPILKPFGKSKSIIFPVNSEMEVMNIEAKSTKMGLRLADGPVYTGTIYYYQCDVRRTDSVDDTHFETIDIIHEDSLGSYYSILEDIKVRIAYMKGFDYTNGWRTFFQFKESWAHVKYNYAITSHKAQGSTYENCMMINWDMMLNTRYEERNRIRYVAATRAKSRLFIVN